MELTDELLGGQVAVEKKFVVKTTKEGVDLTQNSKPENTRPYEVAVIDYATKYSVPIAKTLEEAVNHRISKKKSLSFREADCCFRRGQDLTNALFWETIFVFCSTVFEEEPYCKNGVYELRARFNAGIKYLQQNKDETKVKAAKERLAMLSNALKELGYPLYKEEKSNGIEQEFLKPEWMTWDEFNRELKFNKPHTIYPDPLTQRTAQ